MILTALNVFFRESENHPSLRWEAGKHPDSLVQVCAAVLEPNNYVSKSQR